MQRLSKKIHFWYNETKVSQTADELSWNAEMKSWINEQSNAALITEKQAFPMQQQNAKNTWQAEADFICC